MGTPGPRPETDPEDVLAVFRAREDPAEPLTAPEVAGQLNCSRRTALDLLHELGDRGRVVSKKVGGRSRVWWIPHAADGDDGLPPAAEDPLFDLPTFSGGEPTDVSEHVDEHVAAGIAAESDAADDA